MANSKYEYVRSFEQPDNLLANTWIVVRIDGRGFSKLTTKYKFVKPNDKDALDLMNSAAEAVMKELPDLVLAYGNSDEYSFVFHKDCVLFERRASKLTTTIVSTFTSYYVFLWSKYFPNKPLTPPLPSFDGRAVCYPSDTNLRDYMSWRQADCHINNLYNTTFWALVQRGGMGAREAEQRLSGTVSSDKNEILFKEFGINYNNEQECFKKGTVLYRDFYPTPPAEAPTQVLDPSTPLAQPEPWRVPARSFSKPFEQIEPDTQEIVSTLSPDPGPTFLSMASTPSPPPLSSSFSPTTMYEFALPNPLRSHPITPRNRTWPLSPSPTIISPGRKHSLRTLTPLPLSPPILKPSNHPPFSLNAPNLTTRDNCSPVATSEPFSSFPTFPVPNYAPHTNRYISHSASASVPVAGSSKNPTMQRSPSLTTLPTSCFSANDPPIIPLRLSSIPLNATPRKLSLQALRSTSALPSTGEEARNPTSPYLNAESTSITPRRISPPLRTNKALPSPPMNKAEEVRTREKVIEFEIQSWRRIVQDKNKNEYPVAELPVAELLVAELPATSSSSSPSSSSSSTPRPRTHTRLHSAPIPISLPPAPLSPTTTTTTTTTTIKTQIQPPPKHTSRPNPHQPKDKEKEIEKEKGKQKQKQKPKISESNTPHSTAPMSRTQREKERRKRRSAAVVREHVDVIRDEFWEVRPWILSGRVG